MAGLLDKIKGGIGKDSSVLADKAKTEPTDKTEEKNQTATDATSFSGGACGVLLSRMETEKTGLGVTLGKYAFKVSLSANKDKVKKSVESYFGTKVAKVNILKLNPKEKMFKGEAGKRSAYKKAIVTLKEGLSI